MSAFCTQSAVCILYPVCSRATCILSFCTDRLGWHQEPITRSFHLLYRPSDSTLSRIFLFLEAPPTEVFAGAFIIANHERAVVARMWRVTIEDKKVFQWWWKARKVYYFVRKLCGRQRVLAGNWRTPADITVLIIKRYGTGLTQGYNSYGGSG